MNDDSYLILLNFTSLCITAWVNTIVIFMRYALNFTLNNDESYIDYLEGTSQR
jgi:hypothetical protein